MQVLHKLTTRLQTVAVVTPDTYSITNTNNNFNPTELKSTLPTLFNIVQPNVYDLIIDKKEPIYDAIQPPNGFRW